MQTAFSHSPLSSYLAALGLLRVLSAQLDHEALGFWRQGEFHIETTVSPEELAEFFASRYQPSPCLTPWNKDSGFLRGEVPAAITALEGERFAELRRVAEVAARVMPQYVSGGRVADDQKIRALEQLSRDGESDAFTAWLNVCAVSTTDNKGKPIVRYPVLLGGSGGSFGRSDFGAQFAASLAAAKAEHFQAAIYGTSAPGILIPAGNTLIYDPGGRGDGQQGYRVANTDTQATCANPAELILLAEGLTFFQGYATMRGQDEDGQGGARQASFTLAVLHNSAGHPSSTWLEGKGQSSEELWCPLWEEPCSLEDVRMELGRKAQLPLPRQLVTGADFALFASQLGREKGLSAFARYYFPPRVGKGTRIPSLIEVFPLAATQEDRTDVLAKVADFAWTLRWRANDPSLPASYRCSAERVVAEVDALSGGGGSFALLLRNLVAWRNQENIKPEKDRLHRFGFGYRELPALWFTLLERELESPEWRLSLALASRRPYASLSDIKLLLEDRIDKALVADLQVGLPWIEHAGRPPVPEPEHSLPWLPPDYLAGLLLNQWRFDDHAPVEGDRRRWRELLLANRLEESMEVALHRLRVADVVHWPWPAIAATDPMQLVQGVEVPVHPHVLGRLKAVG